MHKRKDRSRPKAVSGDMRPLLLAVVTDLYDHLTPFDPDYLIRLIAREDGSGVVFRHHVGNLVSDAESSLHSLTTAQYAALRQVHALIHKNVGFGACSSKERKEKAVGKFVASERKCKRTNRRLRWFSLHWSRLPEVIGEVVGHMRKDLFDLLGVFDQDDLEEIYRSCDFGPGLTFGSTLPEHANLYFKVGGLPLTYTEGASRVAAGLLETFPNWFASLAEVNGKIQEAPGNRITVVPKTADIDRTIAIEPSVNVFLQKGLDAVLRRYLQKWGVTIRDQSRNYGPARQGSLDGSFATIDLSSASDTVCTELVNWLIPPGWRDVLMALRSPKYTLDKGRTWQTYEKFSSMGNATTFPLESLIFAAVVRACTAITVGPGAPYRVYGDDLIVRTEAALLTLEVLRFLGFEANGSKTFVFGPFRESCGRDFFNGVDVRPVYLRHPFKTEVDVYNFHNRLRMNRYGFRFDSTLGYCFNLVPRPCFAPAYLPAGDKFWAWYAGKSVAIDDGFHCPSWVVSNYRQSSKRLQCSKWSVPVITSRVPILKSAVDERLRYLCFLLGVEGGVIRNSAVQLLYRSTKVFYSWPDEGDWPSWTYLRLGSPSNN